MPLEKVVYHLLDPNRVNEFVDQKQTICLFHVAIQQLVVLPLTFPSLQRDLDEPFPRPRFFDMVSTQREIKDTTHYYLIGWQHCVEAH